MRLLLLIVGLGAALEAQTVTVRHYSPYSRSGLGMNVQLTGQSANDILTVTLSGIEVFRKTGNIGASETVRFSYGGRPAGAYTMVTSLLNSAGTLKASATETLPIKATGSVVIDQYDNVLVNGKPRFMLTLWLDGLDRFKAWYGQGALTGYGWVDICIGGNCEGPYSATEWQNTLANYLYPYSPYGVIGPSGNEFTGGRFSGTVADYATNKAASDMVAYWYWQDEPDINLPSGNGTCQLYDPVTHSPVDGCSYLRELYNETHDHDPNQRPVIEDFYGYFMSYSIKGKGYANTWPVAVADIHGYDNYLYLQLQAQSPATLCTDITSNVAGCALTVAQYVSLFQYFQSLFYGLTPMHPIIEGGGNADGTTAYCRSGHSCPGPTGDQFRMETYLMIIHGAKGLTYWTSWAGGTGAPIRPDVLNEMSRLKSNMAAGLEGAVLSAPSQRTITSNRTHSGSRVDAMVAETSDNLWVIAQRLTDDIANPAEAGAVPLRTQLTISGLKGTAVADVLNESRTVNIVNGVITDEFAPYATHIYAARSAAFHTVSLPGSQVLSIEARLGNNCGGPCTDGARASTPIDQSGRSNNLTVNSGSVEATYSTNIFGSAPAFNFSSGNAVYKLLNDIGPMTASTVCAVIKNIVAPSSEQGIFSGQTFSLTLVTGRSSREEGLDFTSAAGIGIGTASSDTNPHLICATYDQSLVTFYLDGTADGSGYSSFIPTAVQRYIGALNGSSNFFTGYLGGLFVWSTVQNDAQLGQVHAYMQQFYGTP